MLTNQRSDGYHCQYAWMVGTCNTNCYLTKQFYPHRPDTASHQDKREFGRQNLEAYTLVEEVPVRTNLV